MNKWIYHLNPKSGVSKYSLLVIVQLLIVHTAILMGDMHAKLKYAKYGAFILVIFMSFLVICKDGIKLKDILHAAKGYKYYFYIILFLGVYSMIIQVFFERALLKRTYIELLFMCCPLIFCVCLKILEKEQFNKLIDYILVIYILMFIIRFASKLSIPGILSVNFLKSYSPYECEYSQVFGMLAVFFLFEKKYFKFVVSIIFAIFAMKRFEVLMALMSVFGVWLFMRLKMTSKKKNAIVILAVLGNILVVGFLYFLAYRSTAHMLEGFFVRNFGTSINGFTSGRTDFLASLLDRGINLKRGFGFTTYFLRTDKYYIKSAFPVIHGDQLKIFLEMGLFGLISFVTLLYAGVKNTRGLYFTLYLNAIFTFNHLLDISASMFVFYMLIGYANFYSDEKVGVKEPIKKSLYLRSFKKKYLEAQ
ncbi:hypothetical protein [Acetivibrio cellulolyticus]|uniref:hypothetical protein n=1 Tax=Acetivibrio cellulolyticus TaxID=35830 RepID=UPI0013C2A807|nr:hypothetical protein [Acetivibrio cellulolyticus]